MNSIHSISPFGFVLTVCRRWSLIAQLTHREAFAKYKHSFLGVLWSLVTPLCLLAIYTFVFSEVFHAKWTDSASGEGGKAQFAAILFSGLMVFNFVAECVSKAPGLILSNPNYVKKLVFPLELLPLVVTLSATITMGISVAILLAFQFFVLGVFHLTALFFPIVLLPVFLAVLGVQWFLSALGVYVRDIGQTVGIVLTGLMFLSPIFFPTEAIPEKWRLLVHLNPIAIPIEQGRELLIFGRMPHFGAWSVALLVGCLVAWGGYCWFQFTRRGFADVI